MLNSVKNYLEILSNVLKPFKSSRATKNFETSRTMPKSVPRAAVAYGRQLKMDMIIFACKKEKYYVNLTLVFPTLPSLCIVLSNVPAVIPQAVSYLLSFSLVITCYHLHCTAQESLF